MRALLLPQRHFLHVLSRTMHFLHRDSSLFKLCPRCVPFGQQLSPLFRALCLLCLSSDSVRLLRFGVLPFGQQLSILRRTVSRLSQLQRRPLFQLRLLPRILSKREPMFNLRLNHSSLRTLYE